MAEENGRRTRTDREFELLDTGVFEGSRYFDVFVEYAKAAPDDIAIRVTVFNRGPETAQLHVLPSIWYRNRWSWGYHMERPVLRETAPGTIELEEPYYGSRYFYARGECELLFGENQSDKSAIWGAPSESPYTKSCIGKYVVNDERDAVNPAKTGTKAAAHYAVSLEAGASAVFECRLTDAPHGDPFGEEFARTFTDRAREADEFYATVEPGELSEDARAVMRQAFAGLLWSKQYYHFVVRDWLHEGPNAASAAGGAVAGPQP